MKGCLNGFNTELCWHILWQWEKWTIKFLIYSVHHRAVWWQGWHCPWHDTAVVGSLACSQAPVACALLHRGSRATASSLAATADLKEVWDQRAEAKALRRGVVSAQRILWNSSISGEEQFLSKDCVSRFRFYAAGFENIELQLLSPSALSNEQSGVPSLIQNLLLLDFN